MLSNSKLRMKMGGILLVVLAFVGALAAVTPERARSAVERLMSFTCHDHMPCISVTNESAGRAIVAVAQDNHAIVGRTNINTNKNPNSFPTPGPHSNAGVFGVDASTNALDTNYGVLGTSANGTGVAGATSFDSSVNGFAQLGVIGFDTSMTSNFNGGVLGISNSNIGAGGISGNPSGVGVLGIDSGGAGVFGFTPSNTIAGAAVVGLASLGNGLQGVNNDPVFATLALDQLGTGPLIDAYAEPNHVTIMSLDDAGNMIITGTLTQNGSPNSISQTSTGAKVLTYVAQQSVRTIEDVGESQLVHGQAVVRLEPTFVSAVDVRHPYLVFITPQGDSNGLYVAQKSPAGFVVREHGGASNVAFDYRIVAQPYGSRAQRLPLYTGPHGEATAAQELGLIHRQMSRVNRIQMRWSQLRPHR